MRNKLIIFFSILITCLFNHLLIAQEISSEDILVCKDQAERFGDGKGEDIISNKCINYFKAMANPQAIKVATESSIKAYGFKNMILIERSVGKEIKIDIIAGRSTELNSIVSLAIDQKNKEIAILDESGSISFFSSRITGNVAPYRIIKNKELVGSTEIVVDETRDQVIANNSKNKKLLFLSRLGNVGARVEKQKLQILKRLDTNLINLKDLSIDFKKNQLNGIDELKNQKVTFSLL